MKILIVDDDRKIREISKYALRLTKQFEILEATNGIEALQTVLSSPDIEAIITDLRMPQMDGWEFIQRAKQVANCLVIVLSAYGDIKSRKRAKLAGADIFYTKPIDYLKLSVTLLREVNRPARIETSKEHQEYLAKVRRLEQLKLKQAKLGLETPISVITEIEDLELWIDEKQANFAKSQD